MKVVETITAWGHSNILATHKKTFEITKEKQVTKRGDCIIAVAANKGGADLSEKFKSSLSQNGAKMTIVIRVDSEMEIVEAFGVSGLKLNHPTDLVIRKSSYICHRTLAVKASKAAGDLTKEFVAKLKNPQQKIKIILTVESKL